MKTYKIFLSKFVIRIKIFGGVVELLEQQIRIALKILFFSCSNLLLSIHALCMICFNLIYSHYQDSYMHNRRHTEDLLAKRTALLEKRTLRSRPTIPKVQPSGNARKVT